jgi:hypothetical protein
MGHASPTNPWQMGRLGWQGVVTLGIMSYGYMDRIRKLDHDPGMGFVGLSCCAAVLRSCDFGAANCCGLCLVACTALRVRRHCVLVSSQPLESRRVTRQVSRLLTVVGCGAGLLWPGRRACSRPGLHGARAQSVVFDCSGSSCVDKTWESWRATVVR